LTPPLRRNGLVVENGGKDILDRIIDAIEAGLRHANCNGGGQNPKYSHLLDTAVEFKQLDARRIDFCDCVLGCLDLRDDLETGKVALEISLLASEKWCY
jgi:hypothetical protein